jgi:hypothetical protein
LNLETALIIVLTVLGAAIAFSAVWFYLAKIVDPSQRKVAGLNAALFGMSLLAILMFMRIHAMDQRVSECQASLLEAFEDGLKADK